ncbi:MAG: TetR/AcrR family transcriptional regulator [Sphingomonas bacterium]|nr:TetR/AcrR family transcriptional regulator [Sphingomonas bacterium]
MTSRRYVSPVRAAAAGEKRGQVVAAAARLLREGAIADFSMEAVAKLAGVTRLTVYRQFASRRGLLEAVFDDRAEAGGLHHIPQAMAMADPRAGLARLIAIFCTFWSSDEAVGRLNEAMAGDPEFAQAIAERNERRRRTIAALVGRIAPDADTDRRRDAVDLLFGLTSYAMFGQLRAGRQPDETARLITSACMLVVDRLSRRE